jgi:hypothetical protein
VIESGTSVLANVFGTNTGPEALTVSWEVDLNTSVYTYSYIVNNPAGDVLLTNGDVPTSTPEVVDTLSVGFDTTVPNAYISNSQTGGVFTENNGTNGLLWVLGAVPAGGSSGPLSFQSLLPPTLGNANAQNSNPPSPWASTPFGQEVPVPTPEPGTLSLLLAGSALFAFMRPRRFRLI